MEEVRIWEEENHPYLKEIGTEKNPIFLLKTRYQGSSKVYPYPVIEKIEDVKRIKKAVYLVTAY